MAFVKYLTSLAIYMDKARKLRPWLLIIKNITKWVDFGVTI